MLALSGGHPQTALEAAQPRDGHVHAHGVQEAHVGTLRRKKGCRRGARPPHLRASSHQPRHRPPPNTQPDAQDAVSSSLLVPVPSPVRGLPLDPSHPGRHRSGSVPTHGPSQQQS